jgi:nuclear receptor subfamily 5 group A protein 3
MVGPSQQGTQPPPANLQIISDQRAASQPALQISPDHAKMWPSSPKSFQFDGGSSAPPQQQQIKMSPMIRDFVQSVDDREWQTSLFGLLQNQTYNQCEVDLFELMCKVLDQNLFSQVDWARNSVFFKDLKVSVCAFFGNFL